jgi:hypothetical protein
MHLANTPAWLHSCRICCLAVWGKGTHQSEQRAEDATAQHPNSEENPQVSPVPQVSSKKHPNCICCQE